MLTTVSPWFGQLESAAGDRRKGLQAAIKRGLNAAEHKAHVEDHLHVRRHERFRERPASRRAFGDCVNRHRLDGSRRAPEGPMWDDAIDGHRERLLERDHTPAGGTRHPAGKAKRAVRIVNDGAAEQRIRRGMHVRRDEHDSPILGDPPRIEADVPEQVGIGRLCRQ